MSDRTRYHTQSFSTYDEMTAWHDANKSAMKLNGWTYQGWQEVEGVYRMQWVWVGPQQDQTILADAVPQQDASSKPDILGWLHGEVLRLRREVNDINKNVAALGGRVTGRAYISGEYPSYKPGRSPAPRPWSD